VLLSVSVLVAKFMCLPLEWLGGLYSTASPFKAGPGSQNQISNDHYPNIFLSVLYSVGRI
jgi:hypothetical protein